MIDLIIILIFAFIEVIISIVTKKLNGFYIHYLLNNFVEIHLFSIVNEFNLLDYFTLVFFLIVIFESFNKIIIKEWKNKIYFQLIHTCLKQRA